MIVPFVCSKKRDPKQLFQVLENGLVGGTVLKSFSVTQQISYNSTNSSSLRVQFFLDINIKVHNTTNIPARSGRGLINAEALLGGDTTSVHINYNHRSQHY